MESSSPGPSRGPTKVHSGPCTISYDIQVSSCLALRCDHLHPMCPFLARVHVHMQVQGCDGWSCTRARNSHRSQLRFCPHSTEEPNLTLCVRAARASARGGMIAPPGPPGQSCGAASARTERRRRPKTSSLPREVVSVSREVIQQVLYEQNTQYKIAETRQLWQDTRGSQPGGYTSVERQTRGTTRAQHTAHGSIFLADVRCDGAYSSAAQTVAEEKLPYRQVRYGRLRLAWQAL